ncbi:MAG TPA: MFS transporter, partial [Aminivibrio sp.]|nr:MFS transporter [Aminivibrio sp.]
YSLMQVPVGILADTAGPRLTAAWGMAAAGAGALLFASAGSPFLLFAGRILMGAGVAGAFVCTMKFLADNFEGERFATLSGITSLIGNAGGMTAQAPLALLVAALTWRWSFVLLGCVSLLLSLLCFLVLPRRGRRSFSLPMLQKGLRNVFSTGAMYSLSLNYLASQACFLALSGTWGISYLRAVHRIDGAPLMTLLAAGVMAGAVAAGKLSDLWRSRKKPLCLFALAHFFMWGLLVYLPGPFPRPGLAVLLGGLGFFAGALVIPWSVARELNFPEHTGLSIAVMNTVAFLAVAVLTSSMGRVLDSAAAMPPADAWRHVLLLPLAVSAAGLVGALLTPETFGRKKTG